MATVSFNPQGSIQQSGFSRPIQASQALKELEQLKVQCGVEHAKHKQILQDTHLKAFSYARSRCLELITSASEGHFLEVTEAAFDLLILILKNDPYGTEHTSNGLVANLKTLRDLIANIEDQPPTMQSKCFLAYNAALDSVICHYQAKT